MDPRWIYEKLEPFIVPMFYKDEALKGKVYAWSHLLIVALVRETLQWVLEYRGIYLALLGSKLISFVISLIGVNMLITSFFCMLSDISELTIVKTWNGLFLLIAKYLFGWTEEKCASSTIQAACGSTGRIAWFLLVVLISQYAHHRLQLWGRAMRPREPFLFVDMKKSLEDFNKKDQ